MRPILRATAILGSGTAATVLVGLVSSKLWALLVGPSGVGRLGLLQSLLGLAGLVAGLGVSTGVVRFGADALARGDEARLRAILAAAWRLSWLAGGVAVAALLALGEPIGQAFLGQDARRTEVGLVGLALGFTLAANLQISVLNAHRRLKALAQVTALNSLLGAAAGLSLVAVWGERGIAPGVALGAAAAWAVSRLVLRREVQGGGSAPANEMRGAGRVLLAFGLPYTASTVVGYGVQLALPMLVLHALDGESVGYYRAAATVSVAYLGFLLTALAQDYHPRVAAVLGEPGAPARLINEQQRVVLLLSVPVILGFQALAPWLVPLIYSPRFAPAVEVLEWQLVGDLFKFTSWTMAIVVMARGGPTFFLTELLAGATTLATAWLGMRLFGLAGAGLAALATYLVYTVVVWAVVRREFGFAWSPENWRLLAAGVAAALVVRLLPAVGLDAWRAPLALAVAAAAALVSGRALWPSVGPLVAARLRSRG